MNWLTIIIIIGAIIASIVAIRVLPGWVCIVAALVLGLVFIPPMIAPETTPNATAVSVSADGSYVTSAADPAVENIPTAKPIEAPKKQNALVRFLGKIFGAGNDPDGAWVHTSDAASIMSGSGSMSDYLGK